MIHDINPISNSLIHQLENALIRPNDPRIKEFAEYMNTLIQMKVQTVKDLDLTPSLNQENDESVNRCNGLIIKYITNIYKAKLSPTNEKEIILNIISQNTSDLSKEINAELNSLAEQTNKINSQLHASTKVFLLQDYLARSLLGRGEYEERKAENEKPRI